MNEEFEKEVFLEKKLTKKQKNTIIQGVAALDRFPQT